MSQEIPGSPGAATGPVVRLSGLAHAFGDSTVLFSDLSADLHAGDVVGLVGPSGSGKSTLLSILAGWVQPTQGTVERLGVEHTGWVFQSPHGMPRRTALDHVVLALLGRGARRREAEREAAAILDRLGLTAVAEHQFRELSGGEAQRLMLARAVATASDLLLVDEPTAQLDLRTAEAVSSALTKIAMRDTIVVVATHDPHTRDACTRILDLTDFQTAAPPWQEP